MSDSQRRKHKNPDSIPSRINLIKTLLDGKKLKSLVNFDNDDTDAFTGGNYNDEDGSGGSFDTKIVLQKKQYDFMDIFSQFGNNSDDGILTYVGSGATGMIFKCTIPSSNNSDGPYECGVKVVAYPRREKYGSIYDIRRPENAELKMIKLLSYFIVKRQTPHIILPIGTFDTNLSLFASRDVMDVVDTKKERYREFLKNYEDNYYHTNASVLISEWANRGDLLEFIRQRHKKFTIRHWRSIFFQLLSVLSIIQSKYPSFRHNDLKANNILVHKIESTKEEHSYRIAKKHYKVDNIFYYIKLWDFDFACIPGIVDNTKVTQEWTKVINVMPVQNRYYDIHYFFNTLIKPAFCGEIMEDVPEEVKDFINRVLPEKYQNDPRASDVKAYINKKISNTFRNTDFGEQYIQNKSLIHKNIRNVIERALSRKPESTNLACYINDILYEHYVEDVMNTTKKDGYGGRYINNRRHDIPAEICEMFLPLPERFNGVRMNTVQERGRLLVNDEYVTPQWLLENDEFFEEYRVRDDVAVQRNVRVVESNSNNSKRANVPNVPQPLQPQTIPQPPQPQIIRSKEHPDQWKKMSNTAIKDIKEMLAEIPDQTSKKTAKSKKKSKSHNRTISESFRTNISKINICDLLGN